MYDDDNDIIDVTLEELEAMGAREAELQEKARRIALNMRGFVPVEVDDFRGY